MDETDQPQEMMQEEVQEQPQVNQNNLAASMNKEELDKIGQLVVDEFEADLDSRKGYDERRANWIKLFAGVREKKMFPWANASSTHIPLFATACLQFQARCYEALIGKEIATCYSKDGQFQDAATRASQYLNFQLRQDMDEWEEDMDAGLMALPMMGSMYKKTYFDNILNRVSSRLLGADEFVTPYRCRRLEDAARKTQVIWEETNDIKKKALMGEYINVDDIGVDEPESWTMNTPMPEYRREVDDANSVEEPQRQYTGKKVLLEQHRNLEINYDPLNNEFLPYNGIAMPYVVTVHKETRKVLRIIPRFYLDLDTNTFKTMEYFTGYSFIPNPESHYGYGFGHLIDHINETADTLLNQLIDAGTLSNLQGGFVTRRSGVKRGDLSFALGEYKEIDVPTEDINKAIYSFNFKEPSNVLFTLLGMLQSYVKELTTTADWMSGSLPPSDTAATTMLAVIEQGLKVFSVIQKRCHRSLRKELNKIFTLNGIFMDEKVYFAVQDSTGTEFQTLQSGKMDFASNIEVIPASDPNITSRAERLLKAQQVLSDVRQNPLTANDEESQYFAAKEYYEALEVKNVDRILKKPEPKKPVDLPPQEENAMALKEQGTPALLKQDHIAHLGAHQIFMQSMWQQQLTPQGKKVMEAHIREHLSFAYLAENQELQQLQQLQAQGGNNGRMVGRGPEGMEAPPVDIGAYSEPQETVIRGSRGISEVRGGEGVV